MDKEVLNNGISYFLGPLLGWTLAGVVKSLLLDIQRRGFVSSTSQYRSSDWFAHRYNALEHLEVLKTLITSSSCPPVVLALSAPSVLRMFPDPFPEHDKPHLKTFDPKPLRQAARQALGHPAEGQSLVTKCARIASSLNTVRVHSVRRSAACIVTYHPHPLDKPSPPAGRQCPLGRACRARTGTRRRPLPAPLPAHKVREHALESAHPPRIDSDRHGSATAPGNLRANDPADAPLASPAPHLPARRPALIGRLRGQPEGHGPSPLRRPPRRRHLLVTHRRTPLGVGAAHDVRGRA